MRIDRARGALPPGYEITGYSEAPTPLASWSFVEAVVADPPQCLALAAPAVESASVGGWSASGPGGIVFAVVARTGPLQPPAAELLAECAQWTLSAGHTTGTVIVQPRPNVDGARTVGMSAALATVVEGGTVTRSHADTVVAYLAGYVCFVTLVTDPGSPGPSLQPRFAADLLATVLAALRG